MKELKVLFMDELADMYDAEKRIVKALPKMAKAANSSDLQKALLTHLKETESHVVKLEKVFAACGEKPKGQKCEGTVGILEEGASILSEFKDSPALDAGIISAAQKVEHYEISSYGCLCEWAEALGNTKAAGLLGEILKQEKAANSKLSEIARSCNQNALGDDELEAGGNGKVASKSKRSAVLAKG